MTVNEWLNDNQLAIDIFNKKYRYNNETFDEFVKRVSNGNESVAKLIREKKFLFGGRILSNRGMYKFGKKVTYSNCYVVTPPEDNIESIFNTAKHLARTYSYGGGCGVDISKLAPRGAKVNNTAKETSGAVSFMDLYNITTGLIGQNGRRGALMISMDCSHPDIEEFIDIKNNLDKINFANISVRVSDDFMNAVENDTDYTLSFTRKATGETIERTVKARDLYNKLCENNYNNAEPGMLFWDRIKSHTLLGNTKEFEFAGTNPCAEEPLPAGGSCLLGSMNLAEYVDDYEFNFTEFGRDVQIAVNALNSVLEEGLELHPLKEQQSSVNRWKQIGLGIMGLADALIKMRIKYGSEESIAVCYEIGKCMLNNALVASANLAHLYGAYPAYSYEDVSSTDFYAQNVTEETDMIVRKFGLRNSQLLTIAPTGTLSTMLGISGGIEPIFANSYERKTQSLHGKDVMYKVYTPIVQKYMVMHGIRDEKALPSFFVTSADIKPIDRIKMQSMWQRWIDASISSTINLPEETTVEDIKTIYQEAWKHGLKGVTIFRSGCKRAAVLSNGSEKKEESEKKLNRGIIIDCCDDLTGKKRKLQTGCGSLHVLAFFDPSHGDLQEVFLSKGSTGGCQNYMVALSRIISLACRAGVDVYSIKDQLDSTGACPSYAVRSATKHDTSKGSCCAMAVGNALVEMYEEMQNDIDIECEAEIEEMYPPKDVDKALICPECGAEMTHEGGCDICKSCGYSHCG